ncbi:MAG: DUF308 domain-containing protein [Actinomycetes bacterium]|jgi:uncharacterized membrane protein HdeD (DUF308 family)|nr:DUF308 domain-containing protein [Actinomycetes bacterium]
MIARSVWGRSWLVALLGGILLLALVVLFVLQPLQVAISAVWMLGFFWFVGGVTKLVSLFFDAHHWGWKLVSALLSLVVGAWIVFPDSQAQQLLATAAVFDAVAFIWGALGVLSGATWLAAAIRARSWLEALAPIVEVLLGAYLIANLFTAALFVPYVYAICAAVTGIFLIVAALSARLRR